MIEESQIIELFRNGTLTLSQFGLTRLEFMYYGDLDRGDLSEDDEWPCDILMVVVDADGITDGVPHCESAEACENVPLEGRTWEGIGGEYDTGDEYVATFSYISDDADLSRRFFDAVYAAIPE